MLGAMAEDDEVDLRPTWFRWPPWLGRTPLIVFAAFGLAVFLAVFPRRALDHARHAYIACVNDLFETGRGDPAACLQRGWLVVPELVPWTRHRAKQLESQITYDVAEDTLKVAALRDLDASARDRAARALVDAARATPAPKPFFTTSSRLEDAGAGAILVERAAELDGAARRDALASAVRLGDAAGLARLAALPPARDPHDIEPALGAAACAMGDHARGIDLLHRADAAFVNDTKDHSVDALFALAACDPQRASVLPFDDAWRQRAAFVAAVCGGPAAPPSDRLYESEAEIAWLELQRDAGVDEVLHVIAPRYATTHLSPRGPITSPWSVLANGTTWPVASQWADEAATHLAQLATTATPEKQRDDDDVSDEISDDARANPAGYLRYGALVLELEAAYGWIRRGELDPARAAAHRALSLAHDPELAKLAPRAPLLVVSTLELAGDWNAAVAELGAGSPDELADTRGNVALQRALALAHVGRLADASAALDPALRLALDDETAAKVAWLRVALSLALGKQPDVSLAAPPAKVDINTPPMASLAFWLAAARARPDEQAHDRWLAHSEIGDVFELGAVLPAVYFVVGRAAGHGDVELWLDAMTLGATDDPQAVASARAEAARWRGDAAAEKRWDDRLARIRALAHDDCSAYLLGLVTKP